MIVDPWATGGAPAPTTKTSTRSSGRDGLRVRWSRIRGETPQGVLESRLWLPVVLGDFSVEEEADHKDYTTIGAGEFSVPAAGPATARRLRWTDLQTFTLDWDAPWYDSERTPGEVKSELYRVLRARAPFEMVALLWGREELRMKATLRRVGRRLSPGEADTRYYDLELKEWREGTVGRKSHDSIGRGRRQLPTKHSLDADDTFHSLSMRFYGTYEGARAIMRENGVKDWGLKTPIVEMGRFKRGDSVKIPKMPKVDRGTVVAGGVAAGGRGG